jgi:hypothetical protein
MDVLRRASRIPRKEIIRNVTIGQQIGLEETIIKETELRHNHTPQSLYHMLYLSLLQTFYTAYKHEHSEDNSDPEL